MSIAHTGRKTPPEIVEKSAAARRGQKRSLESCIRMSLAQKGRKLSAETIYKMSIAHTGRKQEIVSCPHCLKFGGKHNMIRYHFNNCKSKENNVCNLEERTTHS